MTTDNRANEPTEAQVEAAARAYDPEAWAARDKYAADGTGTQVELDLMVEYSLGKARAALVAATRVPVRGEPNDDREAPVYCPVHGDLLAAPRSYRCEHAPKGHEYVAYRATVPDAANEETFKKAEAFDKAVALSERRQTLLEEAEAERDAALAAIERVRAIADDGVWRDTKTSGDWAWALDHMAHKILAALDGAPEPEWEYGMQDDYGLSFVGNIAEAYDHANRQDPELNPRPVRRRKAGPWQVVESEEEA